MRHMARKLKKRKPSLTFTNTKLLHSKTSKSTYFYKQRWNSYLVPATCASALLFGSAFAINPITGNSQSAHATINEDLGNGSTISLSILNNGTEIADDGTVSTNVDTGQVSYISNTIKVTTNKIGKYYVGVQSATASSDLTGVSTNATIAGVGNNVATSNFGDNTWGYALTDNTSMTDQNLTYSTLPSYSASTSPQYASIQNPDNGEHELKLTFAAKIRADKPADHYQTTALVSAAAEAKMITWNELTFMQDITSAACSQAPLNTQKTLTDSRDGSTYTIARIKNQTDDETNCWMTQNLRLVGNRTLTPEDSNVSKNYALPASIVLSTSDNPKHFSNNDQYQSRVYYENNTNRGAYYNWYTATAGTGDASITTDGDNAPESICPKGWRLPTTKDYYKLLNGLKNGASITMPYSFVLGGAAYNSVAPSGSENYGYYWPSTVKNSEDAYRIQFSSSSVSPYTSVYRYFGLSVRCVAR